MTDEQKELFEKYADCVREYQTIVDYLIFQNGFWLAHMNDVGSHGRRSKHIKRDLCLYWYKSFFFEFKAITDLIFSDTKLVCVRRYLIRETGGNNHIHVL